MYLMTIYYRHPLTGSLRKWPMACFDSEDALSKLKAFLEDHEAHDILALVTDFDFPEGWDLVTNGS